MILNIFKTPFLLISGMMRGSPHMHLKQLSEYELAKNLNLKFFGGLYEYRKMLHLKIKYSPPHFCSDAYFL